MEDQKLGYELRIGNHNFLPQGSRFALACGGIGQIYKKFNEFINL